MKARLTDAGWRIVFNQLLRYGNPMPRRQAMDCARQIEASVDRALTPTAEIRQHINGTCWCRYITIPEEYVEWVG